MTGLLEKYTRSYRKYSITRFQFQQFGNFKLQLYLVQYQTRYSKQILTKLAHLLYTILTVVYYLYTILDLIPPFV